MEVFKWSWVFLSFPCDCFARTSHVWKTTKRFCSGCWQNGLGMFLHLRIFLCPKRFWQQGWWSVYLGKRAFPVARGALSLKTAVRPWECNLAAPPSLIATPVLPGIHVSLFCKVFLNLSRLIIIRTWFWSILVGNFNETKAESKFVKTLQSQGWCHWMPMDGLGSRWHQNTPGTAQQV